VWCHVRMQTHPTGESLSWWLRRSASAGAFCRAHDEPSLCTPTEGLAGTVVTTAQTSEILIIASHYSTHHHRQHSLHLERARLITGSHDSRAFHIASNDADSGFLTPATQSDGIATRDGDTCDLRTRNDTVSRQDYREAAQTAHRVAAGLERHAHQHVRFVTTKTLGESRRRRNFR
jgi:hypothetical protein